jgi:poly-D-alanine transfer protein DltD
MTAYDMKIEKAVSYGIWDLVMKQCIHQGWQGWVFSLGPFFISEIGIMIPILPPDHKKGYGGGF